jgi:hypothetical protein
VQPVPAPHGIISLSRSTQSKSFAHTQEAHCLHLCCFVAENQVLAGKAGALQVVLAGLEQHKSSETVSEQGLRALAAICVNGIPVTECAKLQGSKQQTAAPLISLITLITLIILNPKNFNDPNHPNHSNCPNNPNHSNNPHNCNDLN